MNYVLDQNGELYHYGVKGMKWGVRKEYEPVGRKSSKTETSDPDKPKTKKRLSTGQKVAIGAGIAAVTALAAYGVYRLHKSGKLDSLVSSGKDKLQALFSKGKFGERKVSELVSEKTGGIFRRLQHSETIEESVSRINPSGSDRNCYNCAVATAARLCGLDVTAKNDTQNGQGMSIAAMERLLGIKNSRAVKNPTRIGVVMDILRNYQDGDVGALHINWSDDYCKMTGFPTRTDGKKMGHVLNWVVRDGSVRFVDGQIGDIGGKLEYILDMYMSSEGHAFVEKLGNVASGLSVGEDALSAFVN